ncbi:MAG: EAL domain-containing protein, partial [Oscillospiraceae bacterium]|nr:EAL domain-containing protein [Oscillospiraceae bacterium]
RLPYKDCEIRAAIFAEAALDAGSLVDDLDFFVLESVCKTQREWMDCGYQVVPISVNFSTQTLSSAGFMDRFIQVCEKYDVQPRFIGVEVTRVRRSSDIEQLRELFNTLHCYDVHVSCENIGIDSEAINVISLDGLDLVKFDISLLQQSGDHLKAQIVLQTLVELCHRLGLKCMVCGVETTEQAVLLRSLGCDRLQGFFLEKPMCAENFRKKYLEDRSALPIEVTTGAVIAEETLTVDSLDSPVFDLIVQASDKLYIYMSNLLKDYSRWSPAAVDYFGLPGEYISNTQTVLNTYIHPEDRNRYRRDILRVMEGKTDRQMGEYRFKNASGEYVWVRCSGVAKRDRANSSVFFIGTMMNIGSVSKFDPITGLYSSNEFHARCSSILKNGGTGAIIMFGLDNFTRINDVYGYEMGDKILRNIAQNVLVHPMLAECSFFRMDGDKMACLMENVDHNEIADAFKRIQNVVQTTPKLQNANFHLSASAGAVVFPENGDAPEILRTNVEYALDDAKKDNRGGINFYSEEMHQRAMRTYQIQEALHSAISNDCEGFYLNYQPLINAHDGSIFGAEALLRFSTAELPFVSPAEFIPLLEESGEIYDVGAWVIKTALRQVVKWRERVPNFCVSVNMSYIQVERDEFKEMVVYELERAGLGADALILELTESCKVTNTEQLEECFGFFKEHNLQIALDDFGTGYSSIEILRRIMPSWVKIDHTFVASISENQLDQAILEYIMQLCRRAGIKVVIEGVENQEIYDFLKQYEPELFQGYHFSRPLGTELFEQQYIYC